MVEAVERKPQRWESTEVKKHGRTIVMMAARPPMKTAKMRRPPPASGTSRPRRAIREVEKERRIVCDVGREAAGIHRPDAEPAPWFWHKKDAATKTVQEAKGRPHMSQEMGSRELKIELVTVPTDTDKLVDVVRSSYEGKDQPRVLLADKNVDHARHPPEW